MADTRFEELMQELVVIVLRYIPDERLDEFEADIKAWRRGDELTD